MPPRRVFGVDEVNALDGGETHEVHEESDRQEQRVGIGDPQRRDDVREQRCDAESTDLPPGQGGDLVVATEIHEDISAETDRKSGNEQNKVQNAPCPCLVADHRCHYRPPSEGVPLESLAPP